MIPCYNCRTKDLPISPVSTTARLHFTFYYMPKPDKNIHLFYTAITPPSGVQSAASEADNAVCLHKAAWALLAVSLNSLYPDLFPSADVSALPEIKKNSFGKPAFYDDTAPYFSLSHSGCIAVCAISKDRPIGVDVQKKTDWDEYPGCDDVVSQFFHPKEQQSYFSDCDSERRRDTFFRLFSCKEAYTKLTGLGLNEDFSSFYAALNEEGSLVRIHNSATDKAVGYSAVRELSDPDVCGDYALACCMYDPFSPPEIRKIML